MKSLARAMLKYTRILNTKKFYSSGPNKPTGQPEQPEHVDIQEPSTYLKVIFWINILAILVHFILFCVVASRDASPVLITHVSYQVWRNVTNTSFVSDTCSNHNNQLVETWDDMQLHPVLTESGGVNVKTFALLWFLCSMLFPLFEGLYVAYFKGYKTADGLCCGWMTAYDQWLRTAPVLHFRYFEYTVSATLMIIALYALTGIRDVYTLVFVGVLNAMCMLFGELADCLRRVEHQIYIAPKQNGNDAMYTLIGEFVEKHKVWVYKYVLHSFGWVHVIFYWTVLLVHLNISKNNAWPCSHYSEAMPDFVFVIFIASLTVFTSFGFVQLYAFIRIGMQPQNFHKISMQTLLAYTLLSLTGKTLMGGILLSTIIVRS